MNDYETVKAALDIGMRKTDVWAAAIAALERMRRDGERAEALADKQYLLGYASAYSAWAVRVSPSAISAKSLCELEEQLRCVRANRTPAKAER